MGGAGRAGSWAGELGQDEGGEEEGADGALSILLRAVSGSHGRALTRGSWNVARELKANPVISSRK